MKSIRYAIEGAGIYLLYGILSLLHPDTASSLMGRLGRWIGPWSGTTDIARANLKRVFPEKSSAEIEAIIGGMWEHFGRLVGEFPHLKWIADNRLEIIGGEHIDAMRDDGEAGIFISGHYGNWELLGAAMLGYSLPLTLIYRMANNPYVEKLYRRCRGEATAGEQIAKGKDGAKQIIRTLTSGAHLGILIDQKMNNGIAVPFLGIDAMTAPATARFALKFNCPIALAKVERLGNESRFCVTIYPPQKFQSQGNKHDEILRVMTLLNDEIGQWIKQHPEQWLWVHNRWPEESKSPPS